MHASLGPVAFLLGAWRGEGKGVYPTILPFSYGEEIRFSEVGKPFLAYTQRTWSLADLAPMHAEAGYWRPQPGGRLEIVLAHPTGIAEVLEGTVTDVVIDVAASTIARTGSAKEVTALARRFELTGPDTLRYTVFMAAAGQPLQQHLSAELLRVPDAGVIGSLPR